MSSAIMQSPKIKILKIFKYCKDSFAKFGINVSFPKNTDPQKTYKWRYLEYFVKKIDELEITDDTAIKIIDAIVTHANDNNLLHKGLSLLASDNILEIGFKAINSDEKTKTALLEQIKKDYNLVRLNDPLGKSGQKGLSNIVKWYLQCKISTTYIALSIKCHEAMIKLDKIERSILPNGKELAIARLECFKDIQLKYKIKAIMGNDFRKDIC